MTDVDLTERFQLQSSDQHPHLIKATETGISNIP